MRPDPSSSRQAWITLSTSDGRRVVALDQAPFTIGRAAEADLCVKHPDVSVAHAEIVRHGPRFIIRDRSRSGTFVNGKRISSHSLRHGDRIRLGGHRGIEMTFSLGEPTGSSPGPSLSEAHRMDSIFSVVEAMGSGSVLEDVLTLIVDSALTNTSAERGFVMLANAAGALVVRTARAEGGIELLGTPFTTSRRIPRDVFSTGKTRIVPDLREPPLAAQHEESVAAGIRHVVCVPIRVTPPPTAPTAGSNVIGVLYLDGGQKQEMLSDRTVAALQAFATQAGIAIDTARLYAAAAEKEAIEQELARAAAIQRALLPPPRREDGFFEVAAASLPSRTVGGDFYDYLNLENRHVGVTVADVAGKGPPAALLAAVVQSNFAALAPVCKDPAEVMTRVNKSLLRRVVEARFATMFYSVITPEGQLWYCNAGQEPGLLLQAEGISALSEGGPPLGLFVDAPYSPGARQLEPGDLLLVYSDGITEAESPTGAMFGAERLRTTLAGCRGMRADEALDALLKAVTSFSAGAQQFDDITVLAMRFRG